MASNHATCSFRYSWSGRERNCVFLNTNDSPAKQPPRFANMSAVSGLDFADDARGLALVDWDQDGDLDLWLRNRSAPRLRIMRNMTNEIAAENRSVSLKLVGTTSNADAVGASAELIVRGQTPGKRLVRTVRAGDAFLSQSSLQLHFGLAGDEVVEKVIVRWPGGEREDFLDVSHGRFQLTQGQGTPVTLKTRSAIRLSASKLAPLSQRMRLGSFYLDAFHFRR